MSAFSRLRRRAFTLVEMLIAMALTLILVYAIAEFYAYVGSAVKDGRAMIEMNGQMRIAVSRLKADLELLTVPVVPWSDDGSAMGYFCIYEGAGKDWDINNNGLLDVTEDTDSDGTPDMQQFNITSVHGDSDDILAFTIRSPLAPFTGQHLNVATNTYTTISSQLAEVIWFTGFTETDSPADGWQADEPMFLYRRQMLIRPDLGQIGGDFTTYALAQDFLRTYWQGSSVSASIRAETNSMGNQVFRVRANSLLDLSRREHRFAHLGLPGSFPNALQLNVRDATSLSFYTLQGNYFGEDRVLSNLIGFDVRVFDPTAPLLGDGEASDTNNDSSDDAAGTVQPGDPGWEAAVALNVSNATQYPILGYGAYVDLYYGRAGYGPTLPRVQVGMSSVAISPSTFYGAPQVKSQMGTDAVYDTWATSYERDGTNQDVASEGMNPLFDEGTDGLDNDGINGVDDPGERETSPPYPVPLRGIQVKLRLYEPGTRQVRQATVGADFIQE